jgi:hypothetical protein
MREPRIAQRRHLPFEDDAPRRVTGCGCAPSLSFLPPSRPTQFPSPNLTNVRGCGVVVVSLAQSRILMQCDRILNLLCRPLAFEPSFRRTALARRAGLDCDVLCGKQLYESRQVSSENRFNVANICFEFPRTRLSVDLSA